MPPKPPRIEGRTLAATRAAAESATGARAVREIFKRSLGIDRLSTLPEQWRGDVPIDAKPLRAREHARRDEASLAYPIARAWPPTSDEFAAAYRAGRSKPTEVVERALGELERLASMRPTMNVATLALGERARAAALASDARLASGRALGPLDGVPFVVKDEFDVEGTPTTLGSPLEPTTPAARDATVVARLAAAGAIPIAKTVLTEWGMSPIGANVHAAMPHNPHDPSRAAGGSSTGTAVAVAVGLAPFGTAGDGGGSIRIPAALNGLFGIKPTFGRVSRAGDGFKGSVAHAGPIASSTRDLARFLDAVASERDEQDDLTSFAPPPPAGGFGSLLGAGVSGLAIGVPEDEWADADESVARAGRDVLAALEREGARLVPISLPIAKHAAKVGYLTIGPESLASKWFHWLERRAKMSDDLRVSFAILAGLTAAECLDAARLRAGMRLELQRTLAAVDLVALPTTAITAPRYGEADERRAFTDPAALDGLCRFAFLANLTGLPAATAPVGVDAGGLPIGLQILGDAWDEANVLSVLAHLERIGAAVVHRPRVTALSLV